METRCRSESKRKNVIEEKRVLEHHDQETLVIWKDGDATICGLNIERSGLSAGRGKSDLSRREKKMCKLKEVGERKRGRSGKKGVSDKNKQPQRRKKDDGVPSNVQRMTTLSGKERPPCPEEEIEKEGLTTEAVSSAEPHRVGKSSELIFVIDGPT